MWSFTPKQVKAQISLADWLLIFLIFGSTGNETAAVRLGRSRLVAAHMALSLAG